jgi:hypothetical protein
MKIFPGIDPPIRPRHLRKKRATKPLPIEIHRTVHSLCNQLSVINLCSFKLRGSLGNSVGPGISDDVEKLQQAVQDATIIAEQLSQIIADAGVLVESKTPRIVQSQPQANNVLPVFAPARK